MAEFLYATSHLAGDFSNPGNAVGNTPSTWAGDLNTNANYTSRWAIADPVDPLTASATQTIRVVARKGSNSADPAIALNLYENGTLVAALVGNTNITSTTGQTVSGTFNTADITNPANVEIEVVQTGQGGNPNTRNSAQISHIEWEADTTAATTDRMGQVSWAELETPAPPLGGGFTFRGIESAITDAATATITINKPTGTVEDDFLIASIMLVSAGAATWQAPSGWTQLGTDRDAGGESQSVTFYKVAGASEPTSYDFTVSDNVNRKHGTVAAYGGVDTTSPIDAHTEVSDAASGGMPISVSPTVDGTLLYGSAFQELHPTEWVNTNGTMTTRYAEWDDDLDDQASVGIFDELIGTSSVSYQRTFDLPGEDTNNAQGHLIALTPAPAGTTDRTGQVSWAELEAPDAPRRSLVSWAEMEVADAPREGQVSWAELEIPTAPREGQVSWAELEAPDAPREGQVSWAELEAPDAPRTGQVSWAELEVPTAPRTGQVSWAEMEVPTAPRRGLVSWAELETGDAPSNDKRGQVSWAELEVPTAPRSGQVSWAELEAPTSPRRALVSWAEMEIGTAPRSAQLSWAEMEMAEAPRVGQVSWAEAEVPTSPRGAQMSWTELEVPPGPRRATVSWAEMEVGTASRTGQVSWAEFEVPPTDARGEISWAEFEVPSEPGGEDPHGGYQLLQRIR